MTKLPRPTVAVILAAGGIALCAAVLFAPFFHR